jgi:hypothetical protein
MSDKNELRTIHQQIMYYKSFDNETYITGYLCWKQQKQISELEAKKLEIIERIKTVQMNFLSETKENNLFSGTAFLIFKDRLCYEKFYAQFPHSIYFILLKKMNYYCRLCFTSNASKLTQKRLDLLETVRVIPAPEPADVLWENLHYTPIQRIIRAIWVYVISLFLIGISFGAIIGLTYLQRVHPKSDEGSVETGISIAISAIITIINTMITICLKKLSE